MALSLVFLLMLFLCMQTALITTYSLRADPAVFAYDFTPVSTDITGVGVSLNIFSIAPCVVVVDAVGVKVN